MVMRKLILVVLTVLVILPVQSQVNEKPAGKSTVKNKSASKAKLTNTLLWEISGKGLHEPSYVFGTMHILCAEDAQLSNSLKGVIEKCRKVYFEIDLDDITEMLGGMKYMRMNDGVKISDLLTKEEYAKLEAYFKKSKLPIPMAMLNRFKPFLVSGLISEQSMNCKEQDGMEQSIMKEAKRYGKEIRGLETVQFQASLFDSIPYEKQAKELVNYIDSIDSYEKSTLELIDVYRKQDLDRMDSLVLVSDPGMNEYMDLLLYNRNRRWVKQMASIMKDGTVLIAVGAGHLTGEQGLLNLLRREGYKVNPVKN